MTRLLRKCLTVTAMAVALFAISSSAAQAAPFTFEINNAVMDLGSTLKKVRAIDSTVSPPDTPATITGDVTGSTVTAPKENFVFPPKTVPVSGFNATINMSANEDFTGTFDAGTGKFVLNANLKATVSLSGSNCVISPINAVLATDQAKPYLGVPFEDGLEGPGAIVTSWDTLPAVTGGGLCAAVGGITAGPGGLWMSNDVQDPITCEEAPGDPRCEDDPVEEAPKVAPRIVSGPDSVTESTTAQFSFTKGTGETIDVTGYDCSIDGGAFEPCNEGSKTYDNLVEGDHTFKVKATNQYGAGPESSKTWTVKKKPVVNPDTAEFGPLKVKPKNKAVKRGKKVTVTATITNVGKAAASGVKICVKAPKKLVTVKKCVNVGTIAANGKASAKFKVTVKKKAKKGKKATLKFTATGTDLAKKTATAKVKVK